MSFSEKEQAFLIELEQLTRKYKIAIAGCGCCGSPSLEELPEIKLDDKSGYGTDGRADIAWISTAYSDEWDKFGKTVVKAGSSGQDERCVMRAEVRNIRNITDEYDSYLVLLVGDKTYPYMHIPDAMPDAILALALRKLNA